MVREERIHGGQHLVDGNRHLDGLLKAAVRAFHAASLDVVDDVWGGHLLLLNS
jgi:hypothetical protein